MYMSIKHVMTFQTIHYDSDTTHPNTYN